MIREGETINSLVKKFGGYEEIAFRCGEGSLGRFFSKNSISAQSISSITSEVLDSLRNTSLSRLEFIARLTRTLDISSEVDVSLQRLAIISNDITGTLEDLRAGPGDFDGLLLADGQSLQISDVEIPAATLAFQNLVNVRLYILGSS